MRSTCRSTLTGRTSALRSLQDPRTWPRTCIGQRWIQVFTRWESFLTNMNIVHFRQCPFDQGHERLDPYGQGLMDPTRFHQQFAEDLRHQVNFVTFENVIIILIAIVILMTLMQGPYGMGGGSWGDPSKASSAFSPINSGVGLPTSTGLYFLPFHSQSTSCLSFPSPQGSTWEALGGVIPSTTQSHSKDKARLVNPFKISIHLELKRFNSTGVTATCRFSHFPRT